MKTLSFVVASVWMAMMASVVKAFQSRIMTTRSSMLTPNKIARRMTLLSARKKTLVRERALAEPLVETCSFDTSRTENKSPWPLSRTGASAALTTALWADSFIITDHHNQAAYAINLDSFKTGLTVENFQPVCSASDTFYRVLQQLVQSTVGQEKFSEYGPLIAGGLLRVRLELCVVESFFNEAVGPFIRDNGLSWVLPLHETVETFLAGAIFALATTFILIGSTKLLTVIVTYTDFLLGLPARLFGGFAFDRAQGKPVTLDIGFGPFKTRVIGPPEPKEGEADGSFNLKDASVPAVLVLVLSGAVNYFGQALKIIREVLEAVDSFVGRYLVLWASGYLIIKFIHFKIFPDFP